MRFAPAVPVCVAGPMPACLTQREPRKSVTGKSGKNGKSLILAVFQGEKGLVFCSEGFRSGFLAPLVAKWGGAVDTGVIRLICY